MVARKPIQIFKAAINALFMREIVMRISAGKTGLFWTFFEPFLQVFLYAFIHAYLFTNTTQYNYTAFIALNFIGFLLFRNIFKKSIASFKANKGLFVYKQVKPINTVIARALVEIYILSNVALIFFIISFYTIGLPNIKDPAVVIAGFIWLIIFSFALGLLFAVLNALFNSVEKIVNASMTILLFTSAVFYSIDSLPMRLRDILLYNPIVHFMELIHGSFFYGLDTKYVDYTYILIWTVGSLFLALLLYKRYEKRIISE